MKKRKFADGGETTEMRPSAKPEGGRFDEDTYSRARRFVESGGKKEEDKTAVKKARKVEVDPTAGEAKEGKAAQRAADMMETAEDRPTYKKTAGGIPIDPNPPKAPASTGEDTSGPSNVGRILSALGAGAGALGTAAAMRTAGHAGRAAKAAKSMAETRAATNTPGAARLAEAAKRAKAADESRLPGDIMDILKKPYKKGGKVAKYAAGGSVGSSASRRADGIATKGKTKCRMY